MGLAKNTLTEFLKKSEELGESLSNLEVRMSSQQAPGGGTVGAVGGGSVAGIVATPGLDKQQQRQVLGGGGGDEECSVQGTILALKRFF